MVRLTPSAPGGPDIRPASARPIPMRKGSIQDQSDGAAQANFETAHLETNLFALRSYYGPQPDSRPNQLYPNTIERQINGA